MIVRRWLYTGIVTALVSAAPLFAQAQKAPKKPANATAECSDGTFSTAKAQAGACSKHGGVKTWFGAAASESKADAKSSASAADTKTSETGKKESTKKESTKTAPTAKNAGTPPAGATGQCADGSYTRAKTQQGGCSNHGGVKTWFADAGGAAGTPATVPPATPKNTAPTRTPPTPQPAPASPQAAPTATPAAKQPAATKQTGGTAKSSAKAQIVAPPPGTPDNASAKCKDGTYSFAKSHSGACSNHGGVSEWYK